MATPALWLPAAPTQSGQRNQQNLWMPSAHRPELLGGERGLYVVDRLFRDYRHPANDVGWKLHVAEPASFHLNSTTFPHTLPISFRQLLTYLREWDVPHKIVGTVQGIRQMRQSGQQGKFLTVYPPDTGELLFLVPFIELCLFGEALATSALGDLQVGSQRMVTARWGGLTSLFVIDHQGTLVKDERGQPTPQWVNNPFLPNAQADNSWHRFSQEEQLEVRQQMRILMRRR